MPASYLIALAMKHLGLEDVTLESSLTPDVSGNHSDGTAEAPAQKLHQGKQGKQSQQLRAKIGDNNIQLADTEGSMGPGLVESNQSEQPEQSEKSEQSRDSESSVESMESVVPMESVESVEPVQSMESLQIDPTVQEWNSLLPLVSVANSRRRDRVESTMGPMSMEFMGPMPMPKSLETTQTTQTTQLTQVASVAGVADSTVQEWNTLLPLISTQNSRSESRRGHGMHGEVVDYHYKDQNFAPQSTREQSMDNNTVVQEWLGLMPLMESQTRGRKRTTLESL
jgi:hypothetical protein